VSLLFDPCFVAGLTTSLSLIDLDMCRNLDKRQQGVLHNNNIYRLKTLDLAFEAAIDHECWEEAIPYGKNFLSGLT